MFLVIVHILIVSSYSSYVNVSFLPPLGYMMVPCGLVIWLVQQIIERKYKRKRTWGKAQSAKNLASGLQFHSLPYSTFSSLPSRLISDTQLTGKFHIYKRRRFWLSEINCRFFCLHFLFCPGKRESLYSFIFFYSWPVRKCPCSTSFRLYSPTWESMLIWGFWTCNLLRHKCRGQGDGPP